MGKNEEKVIGKIIHNKLSIEWMRYNMFSSNNIYKNIPMLVFRIIDSDDKILYLKKCIEKFEGNMKWKVFEDPLSRKGNYLLTIDIVEDIRTDCCIRGISYNERDYLGIEKYMMCCEEAIRDIPFLAKHIETMYLRKEIV